ncbi:MAG TPA: acetylglutamate kinase [Candidatus Paceibacterota bacterium]|nr:acetylglutamate kinase [Candidatus Paceibacterota bacterium]
MTKTMAFFLIILALIVGGGISYFASTQMSPEASTPMTPTVATVTGVSAKSVALHSAMRKLWEEHIVWTRLAILAIVDNVPGKDEAITRLLKNYYDMSAALTPYYGAQAADAFGLLMKDHLTIAAELVTAAKAKDAAKSANAEKRWYANADALATFLSTANPTSWPKDAMTAMLKDHLVLTKQEAVDRITKNYKDDVANFDNIHGQALMMADGLSDGIVKQFPEKF